MTVTVIVVAALLLALILALLVTLFITDSFSNLCCPCDISVYDIAHTLTELEK